MKGSLILFNALSVAGYLGWLGYHLLRGYARGFTNSGPASGTGDLLFVLAGVGTAACVVYSFFAPAGIAKVVASTPLAVSLLAYGFFIYQGYQGDKLIRRVVAEELAVREKKLNGISRDYLLKPGAPVGFQKFRSSFLTHDRELNTIVRIQVGDGSSITAFAVGRINGATLETTDPVDFLNKVYSHYVDPEGKSIHDRYTLRHRPDQDTKDFHLEKYQP